MIGNKSESSDSGDCLLLSIPEDVFAVISQSLSPTDLCNLSFCCKALCKLVDTEKIWLVQCEIVKVLPLSEIIQWRIGISSYKNLCRFLVDVMKPLVGVWVHQNPDLGNVVYVMSGFLSVVGCRIIPQEVGPSGIQEGRVLWSPVFEIICGIDGSTEFFLHGRGKEGNCLYPGLVMGIEKSCNVLLLEVEPIREKMLCNDIEREDPFSKFALRERKKLFDIVTSYVGLHVVEPVNGRLFPCLKDDEAMLSERRIMLLKISGNWKVDELCHNPMKVDINEMWENLSDDIEDGDSEIEVKPRKSFTRFLRNGVEGILGKSSSSKNTPSRSEIRNSNRQSFLSYGDIFSLSITASYTEMSSYQGWPIMSEYHFALYKLPIKNHVDSQESYAGLWGGTFGWQLEDKPANAFYLLMLTYGDSEDGNDERILIGTKILEGTHYVDHPNGSAMFVVNVNKPSLEPFPFDTNGEFIEHSYSGEGIADGYGFRYPGSKPGSLYVISNDLISFVWQETKDVLTLQRLNLEKILKKGLGLCVSPLPPTKNFTYMKKSYINVFTKSSSTSGLSSFESGSS